jgi:hypothetical protein
MTKVTEIVNNWSIEPGNVLWNDLKEQLMELPNDILVDIIDMWIKNYWTNQNYWIVHVERDFGQEEAIRLDSEVWQNTARAQASRLKKVLQLGNDLRDLAITLRFTAFLIICLLAFTSTMKVYFLSAISLMLFSVITGLLMIS